MAKVGTGAAGLQLSYNDSKMPQITQYWGGKGLEEQARKKAGKAAKQAAKAKKIDEWSKKFKPEDIAVEFSKYGDYDNAIYGFGEKVANEYARVHRSAMYGSEEDKADARLKMNKLKRAVNLVNSGTELLGTKFAEYQKADDAGKVSGADRFGRILKPITVDGKIAIELDENYEPVGLTEDEEGNRFSMPYMGLIDGSFSPMESNDMLKDTNEILDLVGTNVSGLVNDDKSIESKQWGERQREQANRLIDIKLDNDEIMSDYLYQITMKTGEPIVKYDGFTDDERKLVRETLYNSVKGGYDKYFKEKSLPKDDRTYGFGYSKDGGTLISPIFDEETGMLYVETFDVQTDTKHQMNTATGKLEEIPVKNTIQGLSLKLSPTILNKTKDILDLEPKSKVSDLIRGNNGDWYAKIVEQGAGSRDVDGAEEGTKNVAEPFTTRKPVKKLTEYRKLNKSNLTGISMILGGETSVDLENYAVNEFSKYKLPDVYNASPQSTVYAPEKYQGDLTQKQIQMAGDEPDRKAQQRSTQNIPDYIGALE